MHCDNVYTFIKKSINKNEQDFKLLYRVQQPDNT